MQKRADLSLHLGRIGSYTVSRYHPASVYLDCTSLPDE